MAIPFLDIGKQYLNIKAEVDSAIARVLSEAACSGGPYVDRFEREFAGFCGVRYCAGLGNGTDALHLAMLALGVGPGDEVIVPANTFVATAWGVSHAGGTPVFADCDPLTWNIDPAKIEERITERTKAVIGVHLYGQPFDVDAVREITRRHGLKLAEDCAQAPGAFYKGARTGSLADIACFSFYPGKNLGAYGEAGGVTTGNEEYDRRVRSLRNHGSVEKYYHDEIGYNMRMDGIHGAVLSVKLKYLDKWNGRRREIAQRYLDKIKNPLIRTQHTPQGFGHVYHLFVITAEERKRLKGYLESRDILPGMHYPLPCHLQKAYAHLGYRRGDFPNAEALSERCLSLPLYPELEDREVDYVIEAVNGFKG